MWDFTSSGVSGSVRLKNNHLEQTQVASECSDDEVSSIFSREEGLECQICWESFNICENVPYVLWCGHTLCKNCILGLQCAVVKFPLFISCPWCNLLCFRLVYKGNLRFPRKNYFLLWMVESMNGDRLKSHDGFCEDNHHTDWTSSCSLAHINQVTHGNIRRGHHIHNPEPSVPNHSRSRAAYLSAEGLHASLWKSLVFFVHLTTKFPLALIFILIVLYAIPASAAILALYFLVTVLFAFPSFLVLYLAFPILGWLVREIIS